MHTYKKVAESASIPGGSQFSTISALDPFHRMQIMCKMGERKGRKGMVDELRFREGVAMPD